MPKTDLEKFQALINEFRMDYQVEVEEETTKIRFPEAVWDQEGNLVSETGGNSHIDIEVWFNEEGRFEQVGAFADIKKLLLENYA